MGKTPRPVRGVAHALPEGCAVGGAAACPPRRHHRRGCADLGRAHRIPPPPSTNPTRRAGAPATRSCPGKGREQCGKGEARSHGEGQREQPATIRRGDGGDHPPPIGRAGSPLPASREMNTKRRDSRDLKKNKKNIKRIKKDLTWKSKRIRELDLDTGWAGQAGLTWKSREKIIKKN